jgi:DNA-binding CsgD family transcriptional regulator/PAS domain-containing protein
VWQIGTQQRPANADIALHDLINQVYETTFADSTTTALLERIAAFIGYEVAALVSTGESTRCHASTGLDHAICERAEREYGMSDSVTKLHGREIRAGEFGLREEFLSDAEFRSLAFYHEFVVPNRLQRSAKLCLENRDGVRTFVNFARPVGPLSEQQRRHVLGMLTPHWSRAVRVQRSLAQADALQHACRAVSDFAPFPFVIVDNTGATWMGNRRVEALLPCDGLSMGRNGLRATLDTENQRLQQAIRNVVASTRTVPLRLHGTDLEILRPCGKRPYRLLIAPLSPAQEAQGRAPAALVIVFDPDIELPLHPERMRALFGFTRAEAQVAIGIVQGKSLDSIAATHDNSVATTRNLLKRVFVKAGVNRQNELAMVILNSPLFFDVPAMMAQASAQQGASSQGSQLIR